MYSCGIRQGYEDGFIEESIEDVIEHFTGLGIDLTDDDE